MPLLIYFYYRFCAIYSDWIFSYFFFSFFLSVVVLLSFSLNFLKFLLFLAVLGLHGCVQAFSSCGEGGLLFVAVHGLLIGGGFSCCGAWALGARASIVAACGLNSCGTQALEHAGFSSCDAWAQ